jgi:hypothetical protein
MDTTALVNKISDIFHDAKDNMGFIVDGIGLAPAYGGVVSNSFVLAVSIPNKEDLDCYDKIDIVIDLLFAKLDETDSKMIDRVRVYDSLYELKQNADNNFDDDTSCSCKRPMPLNAEIFEFDVVK